MVDKVMTSLGDIRSERKHRDCSGLSVRLVCGGSSSEGTEQGELGFVTESEGLCDEWRYMVYFAVAYRSFVMAPFFGIHLLLHEMSYARQPKNLASVIND
ncbi:hypothetical protein CI102_14364 [Trichoderma harzianum]|nr:hypothetical protein CI102_14364 [Trichoderma harzianum]